MPVLEAKALRKEFGTLVAVDDLSLSLEAGQIVGLIGPNGAGKTTLLRMLATLLRPTAGGASIAGYDLRREYLEIRARIGYLPDFFNLYSDLKLKECLSFFAQAYSVPPSQIAQRVAECLKKVGLESKRGDFVHNLSRGMLQRLGVAALMIHDPDVYLLDEPASGLDPKARIQLRDVLRQLSQEGRTVVISSHILTELSGFCTHVAIMNQGKLAVYGGVDEIEQRLSGRRRVTISICNNHDKAVSLIRSLDDFSYVERDGASLIVESNAGPQRLALLNRRLIEAGIDVYAFRQDATNLEDLFLKVSGAHGESDEGGN